MGWVRKFSNVSNVNKSFKQVSIHIISKSPMTDPLQGKKIVGKERRPILWGRLDGSPSGRVEQGGVVGPKNKPSVFAFNGVRHQAAIATHVALG